MNDRQHPVFGHMPPVVYDQVADMENEWLKSETCTTLRLYAKEMCRRSGNYGYHSGESWQGDINAVALDRVLAHRSYGLSEDCLSQVMGDSFVLIDPKADSHPFGSFERKSHHLCGWKIRVWESRHNDTRWLPKIRMITHPLWVEGGRLCFKRVTEFLASAECKVAIQLSKVQSILNDAAPEQPRIIRAKIGRGKTVPAFKVQTP